MITGYLLFTKEAFHILETHYLENIKKGQLSVDFPLCICPFFMNCIFIIYLLCISKIYYLSQLPRLLRIFRKKLFLPDFLLLVEYNLTEYVMALIPYIYL